MMRPFAALVSNLPKALAARGLPLASRSVRNRATLASRAFSSAGAATYIAFENDDEQAFGNYLQENDKVVAYFTASWCRPCRMMAEPFEQAAAANKDITFLKIDIDDNSSVASEVSSVPTFKFYFKGKVVDQMSGANPELMNSKIDKLNTSN